MIKNNMEIVPGQISDLEEIVEIIKGCVKDLREKRIFQWDEIYPSEDIILDDINKNELFAVKDGNIILGIIVLNEFKEKEWESVAWSDRFKKPLIIHRLIVDVARQKMGIGKKLIDFAVNFSKENKYDSIRFDAYSGNPSLLKTYEKMGAVKKGEVTFPGREHPFFCYEFEIS